MPPKISKLNINCPTYGYITEKGNHICLATNEPCHIIQEFRDNMKDVKKEENVD
jgi:hypothetical protein